MAESFEKTLSIEEIVTWEQIDTKILIALFSLADPPITQSELANRLSISPVTLSRIVNSEKRYVRRDWIPSLKQILSDVKLPDIQQTLTAVNEIRRNEEQERFIGLFPGILRAHFEKADYCDFEYDKNYWGIGVGLVRFVNRTTRQQWLIDINPALNGYDPDHEASIFMNLMSIKSDDKVSLVFTSGERMANALKRGHLLPFPKCNHSLILIDKENGKIMEEVEV